MSVKFGILALLAEQPMYGGQLRTEFEARTAGTWPLNIGQVYTTLDRLQRDGLVEVAGPDADGTTYRLTDPGRALVGGWWTDPVVAARAPRNELAIKLALAVSAPGVDVSAVVIAQRTATLSHLQDLTKLKRDTSDEPAELAWSLVLENLIFTAEAELRWLDHIEGRLTRVRRIPTAPVTGRPVGESPRAVRGAR